MSAKALAQIGYEDGYVPILYVLIPDADGRMVLHTIADEELPFWSGNKFSQFVKDTFAFDCVFYIGEDLLIGEDPLHILGMRPGYQNIACPVMLYNLISPARGTSTSYKLNVTAHKELIGEHTAVDALSSIFDTPYPESYIKNGALMFREQKEKIEPPMRGWKEDKRKEYR